MLFRILGPVEVWDAGRQVPVGGPQQVGLLAVLLLDANRVVSSDRLVDELWAGHPPVGARRLLQGCVLRLRRVLPQGAGRQRLVTVGPGYLLEVGPGELDVDVFGELAAAADVKVAEGTRPTLAEAAGLLHEALRLWRGPALDGVTVDACVAQAQRLEERRIEVTERRIDVELGLARYRHLVGELSALVEADPLRERTWAQLMVALSGTGRHAEASAAFLRLRQTLVEQLAVEPSATVTALERVVLSGGDAWQAYRVGYGVPIGDEPPSPPPVPAAAAGGAGSGAGRVTPGQLPAAVAAFTGRAAQLERLDTLLAEDGAGDVSTVVITAIAGTAGVGKTALAVHWAHRVRDRFPDGQLYVNLQGFAAAPPVEPLDALGGFLHALGVAADRVPTEVEQAAALYRSLLADKRVLVLLDNAAEAEQVRPLLPGGPGCLVVVTSRNRLGDLVARDGARQVALDVLSPGDAHALLTRILGRRRATAEPDAVAALAHACAYLPLALRVAAANLTTQPDRDIAGFVAELTGGDRLARLHVDGEEHDAVTVAFDQSYTALPAPACRLFRLLGVLPGPDITTAAAAALTDTDPTRTTRLLRRLTAAHLLTEHRPGRYTFHDLLRAYATDRVRTDEPAEARRAATQRLHDWYLHTVDAAARALYPAVLRLATDVTEMPTRTTFDEPAEAMAWLDAERPNLVAAIQHAAEHGPRRAAWLLLDSMRGYFWFRMPIGDWTTAVHAGLAAAEADGDLHGRAATRLNLADLHRSQGRTAPAIEQYENALSATVRAGWLEGQAAALGNLSLVYWQMGRLDLAAEHYTRALALDRRTGRLAGQANCLGNLGMVYQAMGRLEEAADHFVQSLTLARKLEFRTGNALNLTNLGSVHHALGSLDEALDDLNHALTAHRELGHLSGEADTLRVLADVHRDAGRYPEAREAANLALTLARETVNRRSEADALNSLAAVHQRLGRFDEAVELHGQAVRLARETQAGFAEAVGLIGLAAAHCGTGHLDRARIEADRALDLARKAGYRVLEGQARTVLAGVFLALDQPDPAIALADEALAIQRETGHRLGRAHTLLVLGQARRRTGGDAAAGPVLAQALAGFIEVGAPEADRVRALLSARPPREAPA